MSSQNTPETNWALSSVLCGENIGMMRWYHDGSVDIFAQRETSTLNTNSLITYSKNVSISTTNNNNNSNNKQKQNDFRCVGEIPPHVVWKTANTGSYYQKQA